MSSTQSRDILVLENTKSKVTSQFIQNRFKPRKVSWDPKYIHDIGHESFWDAMYHGGHVYLEN